MKNNNLKNNEVLDKFINGFNGSNGRNLHSVNGVLINYNSEIALSKGDVIYINKKYNHYSNTTQKHINYLIRNGNARLVDEKEYNQLLVY